MSLDEKRELIKFAIKYSKENLGFNIGHAYEKYNNSGHSYHLVLWSSRTKLERNRRSFDNKRLAEDKIKELSTRNKDIRYRTSVGFGGADEYCTITKSFLMKSPSRIAEGIIHEKWHDFIKKFRCTEKNKIINESVACSIGYNESINIISHFHGSSSTEYKDAIETKEYNLTGSKITKCLAETLNELYTSSCNSILYETEILNKKREILKKFNKQAEEKLGFIYKNNAHVADWYTYDALLPLTDNIYKKHGNHKAIKIFINAMKIAKEEGFRNGVEELLKHSDSDKAEYRKVVNIYA